MTDDLAPYARALAPERPRLRPPSHMRDADYRALELDARRASELPPPRRDLPHPQQVHESPAMAQAVERLGITNGPAPGSYEEMDALARIDAARAEELEHERQRSRSGGRLVMQRIEHGQLIGFVSHGRGRGLERVVL